MRKIHIFYDGSNYTFKWLKALVWARSEFKELGYKIAFNSLIEYLPIHSKVSTFEKNTLNKRYDIVFIAHHRSHTFGLGGLSREKLLDLLNKMKQKCNLLVWCDTTDSTGTTQFEVLPIVDLYLKKQLLADMNIYKRDVYGDRLFYEYIYKNQEISNEGDEGYASELLREEYMKKIRLSWNVGIADIFGNEYLKYIKFSFSPPPRVHGIEHKKFDAHLRGSIYPGLAGYQRRLAVNKLSALKSVNSPNANRISKNEYLKELRLSKTVISPFGSGEICFRDFEAFAFCATLIKPMMSHLITYPNWYEENETYMPIKWDFSNFNDVVLGIKEDESEYKRIAENGYALWQHHLRSEKGKKEFALHLIKNIEDKLTV